MNDNQLSFDLESEEEFALKLMNDGVREMQHRIEEEAREKAQELLAKFRAEHGSIEDE